MRESSSVCARALGRSVRSDPKWTLSNPGLQHAKSTVVDISVFGEI